MKRKGSIDNTTTGDIEMTAPTPNPEKETAAGAVAGVGDTEKAEESNQEKEDEPDWNLFHALQSTRGAMGELRQSAKSSPVGYGAEDELKRIEREVGRNLSNPLRNR